MYCKNCDERLSCVICGADVLDDSARLREALTALLAATVLWPTTPARLDAWHAARAAAAAVVEQPQ